MKYIGEFRSFDALENILLKTHTKEFLVSNEAEDPDALAKRHLENTLRELKANSSRDLLFKDFHLMRIDGEGNEVDVPWAPEN